MGEESSLDLDLARVAGVAGLLALVLILAYEVIGPSVIAGGPRPSGSLDPAVVNAYYAHEGLAPLALIEFVTVPLVVLFFLALRERLSDNPRVRFWSTLGFTFVIAEVPVILGGAALHAALVTIAAGGGNAFPLFRFWDLYWNSGSYVLEASYLLAFSLAMMKSVAFPRWTAWMTLFVGVLLAVNVLVLWVGLPSAASLPANLFFAAWFVTVALTLLRSRTDRLPKEGAAGSRLRGATPPPRT